MGFKVPIRTVTLVFEGDWDGASVTCRRSVSTRLALDLSQFEVAGVEEQKRLMEQFGSEVLMEWNLENDAGPIPVTPTALLDLEPEFVGAIMRNWSEQVAAVPKDSAPGSLNGSTSPGA